MIKAVIMDGRKSHSDNWRCVKSLQSLIFGDCRNDRIDYHHPLRKDIPPSDRVSDASIEDLGMEPLDQLVLWINCGLEYTIIDFCENSFGVEIMRTGAINQRVSLHAWFRC